jgi:hypothetical protein
VVNKKTEITLTTLQSDLTMNMYGELTDTYDTIISISKNGNQVLVIGKKMIEGKVEDIHVIRLFKRFYLSLNTKKQTYRRKNSNALCFIKYKYLIDLSSCKILYVKKQTPVFMKINPDELPKSTNSKLAIRFWNWLANRLFYHQFPFSIFRKERKVDLLIKETRIDL